MSPSSALLALATVAPSGPLTVAPGPASSRASDPILSEFLASNAHVLADEDGDFPDWLELHNPDGFDLDLGGWFLSDDDGDLTRWTFPTPTVLPADGYLIVFASGKDRARSGSPLHTDFKLKSSGEPLFLVAPDGTVVHSYEPQFPPQVEDVSYGLAFDANGPTHNPTYFPDPTPGAANGAGGPVVLAVEHSPVVPTVNDTITVTATILVPSGRIVSSARLVWRAMYQSELTLDLYDDGTNGDAQAGDDRWTAQIPPGQVKRGRMIRWSVRAEDDLGAAVRAPPFHDPVDSPEYFGTVLEDTRLEDSNLDVLQWFVERPGDAGTRSGTRASVQWAGQFYDNVLVRLRGGSSAGFPKPSFKFDFNRGHHLEWSNEEWDIAPRTAEEINVNTTWSDKAFVRQVLGFETYRDAGATGSCAFPIRVERNGSFYSVAVFIEQPDDDLLQRSELDPEGALYKMYNPFTHWTAGVEKKTRKDEDHSDLQRVVNKVLKSGRKLERFLFDEIDLPSTISSIAATTLMHDNDHVAKNYYVWRDSDGDGEWRLVAWDKDLTFGRNYTTGGGVLNDTMWADDDPYSHPLFGDEDHQKVDRLWNRLIDACHRQPRVRAMYLRRLRTLMDELLQPPGTPAGELRYEARIEELYTRMLPDADLDETKWGIPNWGPLRLDFRAGLDQLRDDYLAVRRDHLYNTHSVPGGGIIPASQGHPHLRISDVEIHPTSGDPRAQYVEIHNPGDDAVDLSGWRLQGGVQLELPPGTVVPPRDFVYLSPDLVAFRARGKFPKGDKGLLVVGPWIGTLFDGDTLSLVDRDGVVVATDDRPWTTLRNVVPGESGQVSVVGMVPGTLALMLASATGSGPTDTPYGPVDLSEPIYVLGKKRADEAGTAELGLDVPSGLSGITVWFQSLDLPSRSYTNLVEYVLP